MYKTKSQFCQEIGISKTTFLKKVNIHLETLEARGYKKNAHILTPSIQALLKQLFD